MSRLIRMLLSLNTLRKILGYGSLFDAIKHNNHLETIKKLNFKKVLLLAPHPDDDVFSSGGTLAKLAISGAEITVIYFCSGGQGVEEGEKAGKEKAKHLAEKRKREANVAGQLIGFKKQIFLSYPDGKLHAGAKIVKKVGNLISDTEPDIIFLPSFLDNHPDHLAVNEIFSKALSRVGKNDFEVWAYEVWTAIFPNRLVNITDTIGSKKKAMLAHASQIKARRYDKAVIGLNQYRAEINNIKGFAEAFFATRPEIYRKLFKEKI